MLPRQDKRHFNYNSTALIISSDLPFAHTRFIFVRWARKNKMRGQTNEKTTSLLELLVTVKTPNPIF